MMLLLWPVERAFGVALLPLSWAAQKINRAMLPGGVAWKQPLVTNVISLDQYDAAGAAYTAKVLGEMRADNDFKSPAKWNESRAIKNRLRRVVGIPLSRTAQFLLSPASVITRRGWPARGDVTQDEADEWANIASSPGGFASMLPRAPSDDEDGAIFSDSDDVPDDDEEEIVTVPSRWVRGPGGGRNRGRNRGGWPQTM